MSFDDLRDEVKGESGAFNERSSLTAGNSGVQMSLPISEVIVRPKADDDGFGESLRRKAGGDPVTFSL